METAEAERSVQIKLKSPNSAEVSVAAASGPDASDSQLQSSWQNDVSNTDVACTVTMDQKVLLYSTVPEKPFNGTAILHTPYINMFRFLSSSTKLDTVTAQGFLSSLYSLFMLTWILILT